MRFRTSLAATAGLLCALVAAEAARAQPYTLRRTLEAGQVAHYDRAIHTETDFRSDQRREKTASEMKIPREEIFVAARPTPPSVLAVAFESPGQERLLALEQDGKDMLPSIPEDKRVRPRPPSLLFNWQGPRGEPVDQRPRADHPLAAIELTFAEARFLPEQPVKPGDTWSRDINLGETKAKLDTKFTEVRAVQGKKCAVLESTGTFTLSDEWAKRMEVKPLSIRILAPLDGGALVELTGSVTVIEKAEGVEAKRSQQFTSKLVKEERLDAAQLKKVAADVAAIQKAMDLAKNNKLDDAIAALDAFVKESPQGRWNETVQLIQNEMVRQKKMTTPMPLAELRSALTELKNRRDAAAGQNNAQEMQRWEQALVQIATVNLDTLLEESRNTDPLRRDTAAFGLAFAQNDKAIDRLVELLKDVNPQIRGSAAMGLAIRGKPVPKETLVDLLKDNDLRVRGAAVLLVSRTVKPGDPSLADLLPLILDVVRLEPPWPRANALVALKALAPKGSVPASIAIIEAYRKETQPALKATALDALREITGVDAKEIGPFEEWVKKQPGGDKLPPAPAEKPVEKAPAKPAEKTPAKPAEKAPTKDKAKE